MKLLHWGKYIILGLVIYFGYSYFFTKNSLDRELEMVCSIARTVKNSETAQNHFSLLRQSLRRLPLSGDMENLIKGIHQNSAYEKIVRYAENRGVNNWQCDDLKEILSNK